MGKPLKRTERWMWRRKRGCGFVGSFRRWPGSFQSYQANEKKEKCYLDNLSEWGYMSIRGLLFQWASTINIQLSVLV